MIILGPIRTKQSGKLWGPVITDAAQEHHIGAEHGSNNTGELCAIAEAIDWIDEHDDQARPIVIRYDSEYDPEKDGVTVSVQFNDGSQTGYVDAGYMEWAYDIVVETTAEAMRLNSARAGHLGQPIKKDVSKHISGLVVVLVAAKE